VTLTDAIATVRAIQADLEAGKFSVPYPEPVRHMLARCYRVIAGAAIDNGTALDLWARINAPLEERAELPW
jgi:hypothetical protein